MNTPATRLASLREYEILDTEPEPAFDDITRLAAFICGTPVALISLLDLHRQWFKSRVGLEVQETPIELAFCAHAIEDEKVMLVPDALQDPRFSLNPLVTGAPKIRFYAGAPLVTPGGVALGTICAIDQVPRSLTEAQRSALAALARQVVQLLELRKSLRDLELAREEKRVAQSEVGALRELLPMCAWCRKVRDDNRFWQSVEEYLGAHSTIDVTHGICPECASKTLSSMG